MKVRVAPKFVLPLLLTVASGVAGAACVPVVGTVKLAVDATCQIGSQVPAGTQLAGQCFSVQLSLAGLPVATGYAGTTVEPLVSLVPGAGSTLSPAMIPTATATPAPRQIIQTARSAVSLGHGANRTTIYTTDVIVIQPSATSPLPKAVFEQIVIDDTNHVGAYANVRGHLNVLGNSIGQLAPVTGQLCLP